MSNPTELPDLEAVAEMLESQHAWLTNVAAANLVRKMARRAQPEGEATQAAAPGAQALLNAEEMAALYRFQETCQDFDSGGYDVDKDMMKRLAAIGVIESKGFGRYQFTDFGDFVIERTAQLDGGQEGSESNG